MERELEMEGARNRGSSSLILEMEIERDTREMELRQTLGNDAAASILGLVFCKY